MVGMLRRDALGWAPANYNRGWNLEDVKTLRDYVGNATLEPKSGASRKSANLDQHHPANGSGWGRTEYALSRLSGEFDVLVFRIPSPSWIPVEGVTPETLRETVELAHQLFGVRVVVFISMHYCNNVDSREVRDELGRRNRMVTDFARNWTRAHESGRGKLSHGVHTIYVLDQGRLSDGLMEWNARILGFDTEQNSSGAYTSVKLARNCQREGASKRAACANSHRVTVAQVCAVKPPNGAEDCPRNAISVDGMHMCMSVVGPRVVAGLACQLECAYRRGASNTEAKSWTCAEACNSLYMNATTVPGG